MRLVTVTLCCAARILQGIAQVVALRLPLFALIRECIQPGECCMQGFARLISRCTVFVLLDADFAGFLVQCSATTVDLLKTCATRFKLGVCIAELAVCLVGLKLQRLASCFCFLQFATPVFERRFQARDIIMINFKFFFYLFDFSLTLQNTRLCILVACHAQPTTPDPHTILRDHGFMGRQTGAQLQGRRQRLNGIHAIQQAIQ